LSAGLELDAYHVTGFAHPWGESRAPREAASSQFLSGGSVRFRRLAARALVLGVIAGPALPSIAMTSVATGVTTRTAAVVRTVAPGAPALATVAMRRHDRLVGVTWAAGAPQVAIRWLTSRGWSAWSAVDTDTNTPNPGERAQARPGTEPAWRPDGALRSQLRISAGRVATRDVHVVVVGDVMRRALTGVHASGATADAATGKAALGHVYTRHDWGANESMRRCGPDYARTNVAVVVHHTAQSNSYSAGDVPSMIRADYAYHVQTRGWCDIGYNLLVDKFGRIWEGRYGGIGRAVIGAHAEGFNTGTVGVAYLGTTDHYAPGSAARAAFERVAVYAATTWHFDPASNVTMTSGGSPRYSAGRRVTLHRVMGHRDTGETACPGTYLYNDLAGIRAAAHNDIYAPHFTSVRVTGAPLHAPHPVTIRLGISKTAHWSIVILNSKGKTVAGYHGTGRSAVYQWDGQHRFAGTSVRVPYPRGTYQWSATASAGRERARPVHGTFQVGRADVAADVTEQV